MSNRARSLSFANRKRMGTIAEIRATFAGHQVDVEPDSDGGDYVTVPHLCQYAQSSLLGGVPY